MLAADDRSVLSALTRLAHEGICGLAWLDADLNVTALFGGITGFLRAGAHVAESALPLLGLDEQIHALRTKPGATLDMPAVAIMNTGVPNDRLSLRICWLEDEERYLLLIMQTLALPQMQMEMSRQVRARLMAEAEATAKAKELARVNRDLDEFASIVSHDLKAPMRAIRYLADDLEQALARHGEADPGQILGRIREQSRRMTDMLTALHQYARAGSKRTVTSEVETRALVDRIVRSLPRPAAFGIDIAGDWPRILTQESQLDLVLRNLVENAIKHHDREDGHISIAARPGRKALEISVEDDGPGIPPEHHDAAFAPFRTLRSQSSDEGGMGLAFVKKTIELAGGHIELASDPSVRRGTRFTVVWPLVMPE